MSSGSLVHQVLPSSVVSFSSAGIKNEYGHRAGGGLGIFTNEVDEPTPKTQVRTCDHYCSNSNKQSVQLEDTRIRWQTLQSCQDRSCKVVKFLVTHIVIDPQGGLWSDRVVVEVDGSESRTVNRGTVVSDDKVKNLGTPCQTSHESWSVTIAV